MLFEYLLLYLQLLFPDSVLQFQFISTLFFDLKFFRPQEPQYICQASVRHKLRRYLSGVSFRNRKCFMEIMHYFSERLFIVLIMGCPLKEGRFG